MKYTSKLILNGQEYYFAAPSGGGRQPGAHTIAYYPLTNDSQGNDMKGSGTAYDLTAIGTVTYPTVGQVSAMASTSGYLSGNIATIPVLNAPRTISVWVYVDTLINYQNQVMWFYGKGGQTHKQQWMIYNTDQATLRPYLGNHYDDLDPGNNFGNNVQERYNIVYTYDGTTQILYNNTVNIAQQNITLETTNSDGFLVGGRSGNANLPGYISNLIVEDVAWSAQDVQDYFDLTKSLYGIS